MMGTSVFWRESAPETDILYYYLLFAVLIVGLRN
jgi:hypothetical protein